jgi:predicted dehydrogenase
VDSNVLDARLRSWPARAGASPPKPIKDFRAALDDKSVHALVLGTPDHWHAIPTILACQAGKDVYVEKPDGHNILEGRTMVAAARKYGRVVQLGTQARSGPHLLSAMAYLAKGSLGRVLFAKAWESSRQGSIGRPADSQPPKGVDYDLWLGPAPVRPFNVRRFHGSWRWFFDYGTGDLGNDGVHRLDIARWGLETGVAASGGKLPPLPRSVSAHGGKHYFDDAQEWPDTLMVTYDYPGCVLTYEMRIWSPYKLEGEDEGAAVFGDKGYLVIGNSRWRAFDERGREVAQQSGGYNDQGHVEDFLSCMRSRKRPAAELETVGHPSSLLCHLGNAAWRAGHTLRFDPDTYTFPGSDDARQYLTRPEYRKPWLLPEIGKL